MNPACPTEKSPVMPLIRFRLTAMIAVMQMSASIRTV